MNKVVLVGRLTKDPELRTTQSGIATCNFTVACNRRYVNQQTGQREADFINCVAWRQTAEFVNRYFIKGNMIAIDGTIQTRSYEAQDGTKRYVTEVIVDNAEFAGAKSDGSAAQQTQQPASAPAFQPQQTRMDTQTGFAEVDEDDELPF